MSRPTARRYGDRGPVLLRTINGPSGPETIPTNATVAFRFQRLDDLGEDAGDPVVLEGTVVAPDAVYPATGAGQVTYAWPDGHEPLAVGDPEPTETVSFRLTTELTYPDGRRVTTPTRGHDLYLLRPRGP